MKNTLQMRVVSSLTKVFADEELKAEPWSQASMLLNEEYSFQIAYHWNKRMIKKVKVRMNSDLSPWISIRKVDLVPSDMPCYGDHDEDLLRNTPGLYPDPLMPLDQAGLTLLPHQWRSLWVTIDPKSKALPGTYPIEIIFESEEGENLGAAGFEIEIIDKELPKQQLIHTEWFHSDCLATWYDVDVFSEAHWMRIEQFIQIATKNGINMILTPLFTPPLDTVIGGERPTVQLVDIEKEGERYQFNFEKLKRWIDLCHRHGVEYFEFSHLFTQWGAKHAPKIVAKENGEVNRVFGWETDAVSGEYKSFLDQFLPALILFIKKEGLEKSCYFHVSDEPRLESLENYRQASEMLQEHLQDFPVIDALSNYQFYETGLVKHPIPATNHIENFLENKVPDLWTYYCCSQYNKVSNRFFNMDSARNRIIGIQLYKFEIAGFLQWGYNFWYSQFSVYPIDPFKVTDAGHAFPSGDAFVVYPSQDGPIESLRLKVFHEALQDLRALQFLEELIGRDEVMAMLEKDLEQPITFNEYPKDPQWILSKREEMNQKIKDYK